MKKNNRLLTPVQFIKDFIVPSRNSEIFYNLSDNIVENIICAGTIAFLDKNYFVYYIVNNNVESIEYYCVKDFIEKLDFTDSGFYFKFLDNNRNGFFALIPNSYEHFFSKYYFDPEINVYKYYNNRVISKNKYYQGITKIIILENTYSFLDNSCFLYSPQLNDYCYYLSTSKELYKNLKIKKLPKLLDII